jgi:hypothetical protein
VQEQARVAQYDAGKDVVANRGSIAMRPAFQVLFAVVLIFLPYSATAADLLVDGVPIPKDAKVKIESDSTGEAHRRFVGAWIGAWGGQLKHILIVEDVKPDGSASVVYAWGDSPRLNIQRGWKRHSGIITGDTLVVEANFKAEYMLTSATNGTRVLAAWRPPKPGQSHQDRAVGAHAPQCQDRLGRGRVPDDRHDPQREWKNCTARSGSVQAGGPRTVPALRLQSWVDGKG